MIKTPFLRLLLIASIVQSLFVVSVGAQPMRNMSIGWMFGDSATWVSTPPSFAWLEGGNILLLDTQRPAKEQTFDLIDPRSGKRHTAFDMKKTLAGLKALLQKDTPSSIGWPISIDSAGRRAVYLFSGDVLLLNLPEANFNRITLTPSDEKAASISPDGRRIAYVRNNNLFVYDTGSSKELQITHDGSDSLLNGRFSWVYWEEIFGHSEAAYWWSPDSKSIAFLRTDESSVSTMCFPDFQPYQPTIHRQRYPEAGQHNPLVTVGIADVFTGKTKWANIPPSTYEYVVRLNWLPSSDRVAVQTMNRAQTEIALSLIDRASGTKTNVLTETDDAWVHHYEPLFSKDGKYFIWISEQSGYAHAYRYSSRGQLVNQITKGEWSLSPFGGYAAGKESPLRALDEKEGYLYFTAKEKSSLEEHLYRIRLDGTGLKQLTSEEGWHSPEFSPDGQFYLDEYSNASSPPRLVLCRADGTEIDTVSASREDLIGRFPMRYPAFFSIPASDGFPLPAQISKPGDFDSTKKYPVIVYVYGGPGSASVKKEWNANDWSQSIFFDQVLLDNGYLVVSVDNRSSATIGKKYEKSIKGDEYGDVELHDLEDAIKWLKAQPFVDRDRIGIWGWSGGGMYTLLALTHLQDFKAGIAIAPVTDWHYYDSKFSELWMKNTSSQSRGLRKDFSGEEGGQPAWPSLPGPRDLRRQCPPAEQPGIHERADQSEHQV